MTTSDEQPASTTPERSTRPRSGWTAGRVVGLIFAGLGVAQALAFATLRYQRIRFPDIRSYPGALLNSTATAFIDEATFRGAIFGTMLALGLEANLANVIQTLLYTLTTRLGAPGRDRYLLVLTLAIGFIAGWLTAVTGGIAAAFLGHAATRFAAAAMPSRRIAFASGIRSRRTRAWPAIR